MANDVLQLLAMPINRGFRPSFLTTALHSPQASRSHEKGRAFEGQHMKSVEKYPEYQGDPDNIQFLTKDEHLAAHQGSWQNPTNWYYNPSTKEITDFGEGKFIPCAIIELSDPYIKTLFPTQETGKETVNPENNNSNNSEVDSSSKKQKTTEQRRESPVSKKVSTEAKPKLSFRAKLIQTHFEPKMNPGNHCLGSSCDSIEKNDS